MKKLFVLTTVLALGALSSFAQGYLNANNQGTTTLIKVQDPNINSGTAVVIGTPATALFGTALGKGAVTISLYAAPGNASLQTLQATTPVFTGLNSASGLSGNQGTVVIGNPFTLPTATGLDGSGTVSFVEYGVSANGLYTGWSAIGSLIPAAAGSGGNAPALFGAGAGQISSFVLVPAPEPATIALGGLGAAALLLFRRRK